MYEALLVMVEEEEARFLLRIALSPKEAKADDARGGESEAGSSPAAGVGDEDASRRVSHLTVMPRKWIFAKLELLMDEWAIGSDDWPPASQAAFGLRE